MCAREQQRERGRERERKRTRERDRKTERPCRSTRISCRSSANRSEVPPQPQHTWWARGAGTHTSNRHCFCCVNDDDGGCSCCSQAQRPTGVSPQYATRSPHTPACTCRKRADPSLDPGTGASVVRHREKVGGEGATVATAVVVVVMMVVSAIAVVAVVVSVLVIVVVVVVAQRRLRNLRSSPLLWCSCPQARVTGFTSS